MYVCHVDILYTEATLFFKGFHPVLVLFKPLLLSAMSAMPFSKNDGILSKDLADHWNLMQNYPHWKISPIAWGCRIHRLYLCCILSLADSLWLFTFHDWKCANARGLTSCVNDTWTLKVKDLNIRLCTCL